MLCIKRPVNSNVIRQKKKEGNVQDKDYFVEGIILFVYLIFVALFFVAIIATSYGLLYALNYIVTTYPETTSLISQPSTSIEIYHVLLTSILLSICCLVVFKFNENYGNLIEGLYKSNASNISVISEQLDRSEERRVGKECRL